eukprot:CAMPEP_0201870126 /NCGR_PEP_ID=MMETSP0902-20130614/3354_1 /ASSEMBLY_ACC=CAM_ASM_000551 /TAXON_ID=420261 /ORGANISM="Thalassiosira antarctica, Strain CCMP982" /LENGTH=434 /DNA_ID=CAMNT_0048395701 /DNA_START=118 /DNA_END=1423 /DNA_ORIENTATION=-
MSTVCPRPIEGSTGSRVRIIFGNNGNEWLLLLNHDDGNSTWQSKEWKNIPQSVANQLTNCTAKERDVDVVDFGPTGAWFINGVKADGSGEHSWWENSTAGDKIKECNAAQPGTLRVTFGSGIFGGETCAILHGDNGYFLSGLPANNLKERLDRMNNTGKKINFIRLFHRGSFAVSDEEGMTWRLHQSGLNNDSPCETELRKTGAGMVEELAVAGDGSWVVVRGSRFISGDGVDKELQNKLLEFFPKQCQWNNDRREEIRMVRMRAARERERAEQEAAARAERERIERDSLRQEAREAERGVREIIERAAATRISALEAMLEERLLKEVRDIEETEKTVRDMEANLQRRKRSLHESLLSMPPEIQARVSLGDDNQVADTTSKDDNTCVVCQDESSVMELYLVGMSVSAAHARMPASMAKLVHVSAHYVEETCKAY